MVYKKVTYLVVVGRTLNETMLPTPSYMISDEQRESVYEPAEDTFLLLDALEKDAEVLRDRDVSIVVEVGCGSGVVSAFCAQLLQRPACILATDVNFMALKVHVVAFHNVVASFSSLQAPHMLKGGFFCKTRLFA